ncbi:gas vesicle protein GvpO [Streptomyces sp. NPDC059943]|uniref:gas vesicle protein GvpO n=1 Tax=Streptomyces sp. NPDC059943 TaxID=3347010 RepID=UPI00364F68ED
MSEQRAGHARTSRSTRSSAGKQRLRGAEEAAERACQSLGKLIRHRPEGVSAVSRNDDGWHVDVDVLELPRRCRGLARRRPASCRWPKGRSSSSARLTQSLLARRSS